MMRVLISCRQMQSAFPSFEQEFINRGVQTTLPHVEQAMSETELLKVIHHYDGVIAGDDCFTPAVFEQASRLRVISKWGVGIDGIDLVEAERRGIRVTNTPGVFDSEVADVTIGYLVLLARQLHRIDVAVRSGQWLKPAGHTLAGRTLGVIGLGSIGFAVARRAAAMDMTVIGFDIDKMACERSVDAGVGIVTLPDLLRASDVISLNCPLTAETRHLIDEDAIAVMRNGVLLINTARGPLVDEAALTRGLASGKVAGAALDVFEAEPLPAQSPLVDFPQVILGSHNGSNTVEANHRASAAAVRNLFHGLSLE